MAASRYGQIWHGDHHHINIRFPSNEARLTFEQEFDAYHASHAHEGAVPIFKNVTMGDLKLSTGSRSPEDLVKADSSYRITIDGYSWNDIHDYHNPRGYSNYYHYHVPTCCVPPVIVIGREFVDSGTLERHALSEVFGDMPDEDFQSLLLSVQEVGFIDPVLRLYEGQILDGWHRYRVAKELNLIRKLKFKDWDDAENRDGDPRVFVFARNVERRQLNAAQRAQITVAFNERFGLGNIKSQRSGSPSGEPKTREALAKQAGVGTSTIDRAIAVAKEGESESVISGEKTAGEVLKLRDAEKLLKQKKQLLKNIWDKRKQVATDYVGDGDTDLNLHLTLPEIEKAFAKSNPYLADAFKSALRRIDKAVSFKNFQERALEVDESGVAKVAISDLQSEFKALSTYAGDLRLWKREDWSPDTNWILPLILAKKQKAAIADSSGSASEETSEPPDIDIAVENVVQELQDLWATFHAGNLSGDVSESDFACAAAKHFGWYQENDYGSGENYLLEEDFALFKNLGSVKLIQEWRRRIQVIHSDVRTGAEWVVALIPGSVPLQETPLAQRTQLSKQTEAVLDAFRNILKANQVYNVQETLDDILRHFCHLDFEDVRVATIEQLEDIISFFQPLLLKDVSEYPDFIRYEFPERELVMVSIGVSTDSDEFHIVEWTDEASNCIQIALGDLPEKLRETLLNLASAKIYDEEVRPLQDGQ